MSELATINSVGHAIRLVEWLAGATVPSTVSEMAGALALPRATVYRLLRTLMQFAWVTQEGTTYRLSYRLPGVWHQAMSGMAFAQRMMPRLQDLVDQTGETAHFAALDGDRAVYLAKIDSPHPIRMFSQVGWRGPLHATGAGKVLLAWSPPALLARICAQGLARFTSHTIVGEKALRGALRQVRAQGYAVDAQELIDGLTCVAVPIIHEGSLLGALSIAGPTARMDDLASLSKRLKAAAVMS